MRVQLLPWGLERRQPQRLHMQGYFSTSVIRPVRKDNVDVIHLQTFQASFGSFDNALQWHEHPRYF